MVESWVLLSFTQLSLRKLFTSSWVFMVLGVKIVPSLESPPKMVGTLTNFPAARLLYM